MLPLTCCIVRLPSSTGPSTFLRFPLRLSFPLSTHIHLHQQSWSTLLHSTLTWLTSHTSRGECRLSLLPLLRSSLFTQSGQSQLPALCEKESKAKPTFAILSPNRSVFETGFQTDPPRNDEYYALVRVSECYHAQHSWVCVTA